MNQKKRETTWNKLLAYHINSFDFWGWEISWEQFSDMFVGDKLLSIHFSRLCDSCVRVYKINVDTEFRDSTRQHFHRTLL